MPTYEYLCNNCGLVHDEVRSYEARDAVARCPSCLKRCRRAWITPPGVKGDDCDWSNENNGRGRLNPQTKMYHKNRGAVVEEAKKRGWDYSFGS